MSAADDDDLEGDDKLTSMRAVWLSMRDEEPSDKGLAALMAAAREQAGTMKDAAAAPEESWWQKVLAVFRRPPVLALASVAILVSGALVVANRSDKMAVDERAESTGPAGTTAPAPETDRRAEPPAAGSAVLDYAAPGSGAAVPEIVAAPEEPQKTAKVEAPVVKPRPARERTPERRTTADAVKTAEDAPPPAPPAPPAPLAPPPRSPVGDPAVSTEPTVEAPASVTRGPTIKLVRPEPIAGGLGATSTGTMSDGESTGVDIKDKNEAASGRAQTRVLQLVKQCESAAARGDCAAVKVIAARIRSEDASTYKARVVKNASIARCLE